MKPQILNLHTLLLLIDTTGSILEWVSQVLIDFVLAIQIAFTACFGNCSHLLIFKAYLSDILNYNTLRVALVKAGVLGSIIASTMPCAFVS